MDSFKTLNELTLPPQVTGRLQELEQLESKRKLTARERQELQLILEADKALAEIRVRATAVVSAPSQPGRLTQTARNGLPVVVLPVGVRPIDPDVVRRTLQEATF